MHNNYKDEHIAIGCGVGQTGPLVFEETTIVGTLFLVSYLLPTSEFY